MTLFELKDKYQREALNYWHAKGCKGTLEIATGFGKTRCGVLAVEWVLRKNSDARILILTPREIIRDRVFPEEFKKWNLEHLLEKIEIQCIQTAYKRSGESFDLIVADEVHNYLSDHYSLFFSNNCKMVLGLSAYIPLDRYPIINSIAPKCYEMSTDKAVELGLISGYIEYNIPVKLSDEESAVYKSIQSAYEDAEEKLGGSMLAYSVANDAIYKLSKKAPSEKTREDIELLATARKYWKAMLERKKLLYGCKSKKDAVLELIGKLKLKQSIIFSQSTKFADSLCKGRKDILPFHTNLKSKGAMELNMSKFLDIKGKINHLSTCKCTEEGLDIPKLPAIINASRTSSPKSHIQKRGRCLRFEYGKISFIFNLYVDNTQDQKWLESAQSTTDKRRIKWMESIEDVRNDIRINNF